MKKSTLASLLILLPALAALSAAEAIAQTPPAPQNLRIVSGPNYTTNFPLTENPISEGGAWHHLDPTLKMVRTEVLNGVHVAHGTQNGSGGYDDSSAYLAGFPQDHRIQGTVWVSPSIPGSTPPFCEIELLLRWRDDNAPFSTPYGITSATGYEINVDHSGQYMQLGSFKGPLLATASAPPIPKTGDIFGAQVVTNGNGTATITVYWNGVEKIKYTHAAPVTGGNPGIGFFVDSCPNDRFGFSSVTATGLSP